MIRTRLLPTALLCLFGISMAAGPALAESTPTPPLPTVPGVTGAATAASPAAASGGQELTGTFKLTAAACGSGAVKGSYFRMIQPGGTAAAGPYVQNTDSTCADKTYTAMAPGSDGGLVTGSYQAQPDPPFDSTGGGKAARITTPTKFYGVNFATATNPSDPQTGTKASPPKVAVDSAG